jgi:hypothetical protein
MPGLSKKEKRLAKKAAEPAEPKIELPKIQLPRFDWLAWARRILNNPATSYITILLLQLKVIWGLWSYKDMAMGDTEAYFIDAANWIRNGKTSIAWSPLYSSFLAELFHFSSDAYTILILHRVLIVLTLAVLVLALMRRLLPPAIAWMAAAWWAVEPIDFNDLYEVHMFAVIPLVLAPLAVLWWPGPWGRGSAIAILLTEGFLVRTENFASAVLLAVLALSYEFLRNRKLPEKRAAWNRAIPAYGVPLLCAMLFASYYYVNRAYDPWGMLEAKHDLNVCESFAVGYQQRRHDFDSNPMGNCGQLMHRLFGASVVRGSDLSPDTMSTMPMMTALRANPPVMLAHFWWNIRLLPSGLQVLLFNYRSGDANPDYAPTTQSNRARIPSAALCAVLALGAYLFLAERKQWMETWRAGNTPFQESLLETRIWAWITLACVCLIVGSVIVTVRPRPAYLFILGITIRAVAGLCAYLVLRRWPLLRAPVAAVAVVWVAATFLRPSVYEPAPRSRPLLQEYRHLEPYSKFFQEPNFLLVAGQYGGQLETYIGKCRCPWKQFGELRQKVTPERTLSQVFDQAGATLFMADESILADPLAQQFLADANQLHWDVVAERHVGPENWAILHRTLPIKP